MDDNMNETIAGNINDILENFAEIVSCVDLKLNIVESSGVDVS